MRFSISKEALQTPLMAVFGAVAKKTQFPILSHILIQISGSRLSFVGSDGEIELSAETTINNEEAKDGQTTVNARNLFDITRSLPNKSQITLEMKESQCLLRAGRARFALATLAPLDFPRLSQTPAITEFSVSEKDLKSCLEATHFALAEQDIRFFLNGLYWHSQGNQLTIVGADGHRMAIAPLSLSCTPTPSFSLIVPKRATAELLRIMSDTTEKIAVSVGKGDLRLLSSHFSLTTKLIDATFPDYQPLLKIDAKGRLVGDRDELREAFSRVSILSNEEDRVICLHLKSGNVKVSAVNRRQEQAEEIVKTEYEGPDLEIGFNVRYLLDALNVMPEGAVEIIFQGETGSAMLKSSNKSDLTTHLIMPLKI